MSPNAQAIRLLLSERLWTVQALSERWGLSRRHVTAKVADINRGQLWNDAFSGLPSGPGLYRRASKTQPSSFAKTSNENSLVLGSLVASEGEFDTFGFGSRGIVVGVESGESWTVVWDGGSVMQIDSECLMDWVVDLGLVHSHPNLEKLELSERVTLAQKLDLYA